MNFLEQALWDLKGFRTELTPAGKKAYADIASAYGAGKMDVEKAAVMGRYDVLGRSLQERGAGMRQESGNKNALEVQEMREGGSNYRQNLLISGNKVLQSMRTSGALSLEEKRRKTALDILQKENKYGKEAYNSIPDQSSALDRYMNAETIESVLGGGNGEEEEEEQYSNQGWIDDHDLGY